MYKKGVRQPTISVIKWLPTGQGLNLKSFDFFILFIIKVIIGEI